MLSHGPNFAVAPRTPHGDYITAIEQACLKLELITAMRGALRNSKDLQATSPNKKSRHLQSSRKDQSRVILTVHKGVAIVIMNKEEYQEKAKALLEDQGTYKALKTDPTGRLKSKMINLLKKIKSEGGIDEILYKNCTLLEQ